MRLFQNLVLLGTFLIGLNGKACGASVLQARPDDDFSPSATATFPRAYGRTRHPERPGSTVLRGHCAHRSGPLHPSLRMVRQRLPTLSAHLAGARFHRQARLSVPHHQCAPGRLEVPAAVAPTLWWGKSWGDSQRSDLPPRLRRVCGRPVAPANPRTQGQNPRPRFRRHPASADGSSQAKCVRPRRPNGWPSSRYARWRITWRTCPSVVTWVASVAARGIKKVGSGTNSIGTPWTETSRSVRP